MSRFYLFTFIKMATFQSGNVCDGNTKSVANMKARNYLLTLNDITIYEYLSDSLKTYKTLSYLLAYKEEAPTTGHKHIHIYIHFNNAIKLSPKKCMGAHIDICRGTPQQIIKYVSKDGDKVEEWGEKPHKGGRSIKEVKEMSKEERNNLPVQYIRIVDKINKEEEDKKTFFNMLDEIQNENLKGPQIYYLTGGTGMGKTYNAYKMALNMYPKEEIGKLTLKNEFIDIINESAKCFIIEEFRPSQIKASDFLQLTDKYGYRANIKGGFQTLRPECLFICSIIPPTEIYKEEVNKQFLRRITKIIDLNKVEPLEEDTL